MGVSVIASATCSAESTIVPAFPPNHSQTCSPKVNPFTEQPMTTIKLNNAIAQTIDFLNQLDGMFVNAIKSEIYPEKTNDFNQLHIKCKNAIKLLKTPPLYSTEEI